MRCQELEDTFRRFLGGCRFDRLLMFDVIQQERHPGGPSPGLLMEFINTTSRHTLFSRCEMKPRHSNGFKPGESQGIRTDRVHQLLSHQTSHWSAGALPAHNHDRDAVGKFIHPAGQQLMERRIGRNFMVVIQHNSATPWQTRAKLLKIAPGKRLKAQHILRSERRQRSFESRSKTLCGETEEMKERRRIGITFIQPIPQDRDALRFQITGNEGGLPGAGRSRDPNQSTRVRFIEQAEQPRPLKHDRKSGRDQLGIRNRTDTRWLGAGHHTASPYLASRNRWGLSLFASRHRKRNIDDT